MRLGRRETLSFSALEASVPLNLLLAVADIRQNKLERLSLASLFTAGYYQQIYRLPRKGLQGTKTDVSNEEKSFFDIDARD
jgi:hypothetical protein